MIQWTKLNQLEINIIPIVVTDVYFFHFQERQPSFRGTQKVTSVLTTNLQLEWILPSKLWLGIQKLK